MKNYMKPDVFVTEFQLNEAIAACDPTTEPNLNAVSVEVHCVKTNKHEVFYDACDNRYSASDTVSYNNVTYMKWPYESADDIDCGWDCDECTDSSSIYDGLANIYGHGWHFAPVTDQVREVINSSL